MKIQKAKELNVELQEYVKAYESYQPKDVKEEAVKLYAELENVNMVAKELNEKGYRKDGKLVAGKVRQMKIESNDVTAMLDSSSNPGDRLHEIVKKTLSRNRKRKGIS
ncbi:hypothetical protein NC661_06495 [Aquibacillus koreensis]|uniref:Uncharacterized protein n=1 Tax=Aquibacillus koreensis TaxID=279446 RepID=A0A9X3WMI9_9BACI|nr:hypothetical protein [Aquibacillus koreensis]MCT2535699.1 hypothetical protein [Aquibacillus koreensis]MDC3420016.1 hypothetical protein [Aquibacillus koreensis]